MNTFTKKIVLLAFVMLLSACAYHPNHHNSYPSNGPYYSGPSYGNYQRQRNYAGSPGFFQYRGYGKPYGGHHFNNYYQNNNYNRPQPRQNPMLGYGYRGGDGARHHGYNQNYEGHQQRSFGR